MRHLTFLPCFYTLYRFCFPTRRDEFSRKREEKKGRGKTYISMCIRIYTYIYIQERKKEEKGNNSPEETAGLKFTKDRIALYIHLGGDRGRKGEPWPCFVQFRFSIR